MPEALKQMSEDLYSRILDYCKKCIDGEITVCKKHKWAIERFYKDLADERFFFDKLELVKFYIWSKNFKHRAGIIAGNPIELCDFQLFLVGNLLCLKKISNGKRKYKKAYIQLARKNAKTQILSLISSYIAFNGEEQQECYVAGWTSEQSKNLYRDLEFQLKGCPKLHGKFKTSYGKVTVKKDGSFIQPLTRESRKTGDGTNPALGICDRIFVA